MQVPILNGIYTDESSDFRTSYPKNLVPVPKDTGISHGYLRPADGIKPFGAGPGEDRGGINWNGSCYRVMGTSLIKVLEAGDHIVLGDVGGSGHVILDYGPDYLGILSSNNLYLYNESTGSFAQITDSDLGKVIDFIWIDGYYMATDGLNIIVTELANPFSVDSLKYGSSEADPDPIKALLKVRNEAYALNRNTIEVFDNIGGNGFPFQRIEGAQIEKGTIGTNACCVFTERIAFVGSGFNEAPSIYLGFSGQTVPIATREIDIILKSYTTEQLSEVVCEARVNEGHNHLWVRLPDQTLVYDATASVVQGEPVWFVLTSSITGLGQYRAKNLVWCYDKWLVGDTKSSNIGYLVSDISDQYGEEVGWEFGTMITYNSGNGAIFNELELVCLSGRVKLGVEPTIYTQYSLDGETWSMPKGRTAGKQGQRNKRIAWLSQGKMRNWRIQRFKGTSEAHLTIARLEVKIESLNA